MKKTFNSKKIATIAIADLLIFAISILTFAYFDHVRGWDDVTPAPDIKPPSFETSADELSKEDDSSDTESTDTSDVSVDQSEEPSSEPEKESMFTDGEVISTETLYQSAFVRVELKEIYYDNHLYMVEDIYVKHIESLAVGFAKGLTPLSGQKSTIYQMVEHYRNNGYNIVAAINGDYCGYNSKGVTIRNGELYGKGIPQFDVCVIYKDGTMVTMEADEFNTQVELAKGAWHVWDFGPNLLDDDGKALTDFSHRRDINGSNPRSAIGYYEPGHYCFVVAGGRGEQSYGVKLSALAGFMESIGCKTAYNLDGGKSSILVYGQKIVNEKYQDVTRRNTDMIFIQDFPAN